jgi:glycosyltransferase involved in cell wall biosynthesis
VITDELPVVSVITPTYNRATFIIQAVESVLAQSFQNWEMIIVDDGSTDPTRDQLEPYLKDPRIHYLYQNNQGQSRARNTALECARGRFIGFLDSDDVWYPRKLERQIAILETDQSVAIVHSDESQIDEHGRDIEVSNMRRYSGWITPQLLADNSVSITTALVRRECFDEMGGMDSTLPVADDYELWLRLSARYRFCYLPERLAAYRVMPNQISSDKKLRFETNEKIIERFLERFGSVLTPSQRRWGLSRFYCRKSRYFSRSKDRKTAFSACFDAFRLAPLSPLVWRAFYRVFFRDREE